MLSKEQSDLLSWLRNQPAPVSMTEMAQMQAPGFSSLRVETMRKAGLLDRGTDFKDGEITAVYTVSDLGRAALSELEEIHRKQAKQERQQRFENKVAIAQVLVPLVTFILGLTVEHFAGVLGRIFALFG